MPCSSSCALLFLLHQLFLRFMNQLFLLISCSCCACSSYSYSSFSCSSSCACVSSCPSSSTCSTSSYSFSDLSKCQETPLLWNVWRLQAMNHRPLEGPAGEDLLQKIPPRGSSLRGLKRLRNRAPVRRRNRRFATGCFVSNGFQQCNFLQYSHMQI